MPGPFIIPPKRSLGIFSGLSDVLDSQDQRKVAEQKAQQTLEDRLIANQQREAQNRSRTIEDALRQAQADALRAPKPTVPRNIDPLSAEGIEAAAQRAAAVAKATPSKGPTEAQQAAKTARIGQRENQLHDDFQQDPAVKQAGSIANAVAQLRASAANKTPQGDLNMIYGIVKLRDPGSVVREGEIDLQRVARSLGTRVATAWQRALSGKILTDKERQEILAIVDATVDEQTKLVNPVMAEYGAKARTSGGDSAFVARDPLQAVRRQPTPTPGAVLPTLTPVAATPPAGRNPWRP